MSVELDQEWIELIQEAKSLGITIDEILELLKVESKN